MIHLWLHPLITQYIMELTFSQAAKGVNKEISVNVDSTCQRCDGKGHEPGTKVQHCHHCNGSGMVRVLTSPLYSRLYGLLLTDAPSTPVGDHKYRSVCDALHMPSLRRQRHSDFYPVPLLPWDGTHQAEENCDGPSACR